MLFSTTESQQHILNNCCSYVYSIRHALCQQSVMANVLTALYCIIIGKP